MVRIPFSSIVAWHVCIAVLAGVDAARRDWYNSCPPAWRLHAFSVPDLNSETETSTHPDALL